MKITIDFRIIVDVAFVLGLLLVLVGAFWIHPGCGCVASGVGLKLAAIYGAKLWLRREKQSQE